MYAPRKVFILEKGGYTELSYEEFCRRKETDPSYAGKLFLPLYGMIMEVSKADYDDFYHQERRQKYIDERSAENGDISYDMLTTDDFNGEDNPRAVAVSAAVLGSYRFIIIKNVFDFCGFLWTI